ncbi:MAG: GLPGLI family protein, partial [Flavisolibacter sp.]|nr:GLPGLI family protein [Flavisolibacter sp.]
MKTIWLSLFLLFSLAGTAQMKEGKVVYDRTIQMQNRFQGMNEEVARQLPRSRTDHFELLFGNNQTLWQRIPDVNEESNTFASGGMVMRFGGNDEVVYYNLSEGKRVEQREMMDKKYLIEEPVQKMTWKLSDETKNILGYTAHKATGKRIGTRMQMSMENGEMKRQEVADTSFITAWYTTEIPVSAGPGADFGGQLPGLILELEMNGGRIVYRAAEVSP